MIEQQVRPWDVLDQRVLDVLGVIPRDQFVSEALRGIAYSDYPLPIGHGRHMFKPIVDGRLLQALAIEPGDRILEIGTGSGYLTACLASLGTQCHSLEIQPLLADAARSRLKRLAIDNASIRTCDAAAVTDLDTEYEAIAFGGAVGAVPDTFLHGLKPGGRLFAIVGNEREPTQEAMLFTRVSEREWQTESLFETRVEPLVNFQIVQPAFEF